MANKKFKWMILGLAILLVLLAFVLIFKVLQAPKEKIGERERIQNSESEVRNTKASNDQYVLAKAEKPVLEQIPQYDDPNYMDQERKWEEDQEKIHNQEDGYDADYRNFYKTQLGNLIEDDRENTVVSPLSIYLASGMLAETTAGESQAQLLDFLQVDDIDDIRLHASDLWLANYQADGSYASSIGNSIWLNDRASYNMDTMNLLKENYRASVFSGNTSDPKYTEAFQEWINEETGGQLEDSIENLSLKPETVLAIISAIYFEASWADEFYESMNTEDTFQTLDGDITTTFMNQDLGYTSYVEGDNFTAISKDFSEGGKMWFYLPDEGTSPEEVLSASDFLDFSAGNMNAVNESSQQVLLSLPKFKFSEDLDLIPVLTDLGVVDIFDPEKSNFGPLGDFQNPLLVTSYEHAAMTSIDEKGVVAAGYTAIIADATAAPMQEEKPIEFTLDRPFIFVIANEDKAPLFIGIVHNPSDTE